MQVARTLLSCAVVLLCAVSSAKSQPAEPLAVVDGQPITDEEVTKAAGIPLQKMMEQVVALKRYKLTALIDERLLAQEAARRGMSTPALLDAEVTGKVGLVTEQEIETALAATPRAPDGDEAALRDETRSRLQNQKLASRRGVFMDELRKKANVVINLKAPPVTRVELTAEAGIATGAEKAPVTIVEFTDFHCPFCKRVRPTVAELMTRYGEKVRYVHRDFPIDKLHPGASRAHEAARCAEDQGKFWPYHDVVFAGPAKSAAPDLRAFAEQAKLDVAAFDACVASGKHKPDVQADIAEGQKVGVTGTPSFFINGRRHMGAYDIESLSAAVRVARARALVAS
jgi:protein-disulfide isomerase